MKLTDKYRRAIKTHDKILKKNAKLDPKPKMIEKKIKHLEAHLLGLERLGFNKIAPIPEISRNRGDNEEE